MPDSTTRTLQIDGMSCAHCVRSVTEQLSDVEGVHAVEVDLPTGRVTVTGLALDDQTLRAAIQAAGYELAP